MANPKKTTAAWTPRPVPAPVPPIEEPTVVSAPVLADEPAALADAMTEIPSIAAPAPSVAAPAVNKMFEAPVKSMTEAQAKMRAMIEKSLSETRANFAKAKSAADEANSAFEASFATAKTGVVEINAKALDAFRASAEANFDFVKSVLGVKSVSDYVTLHSEFARKQIETLTGQTKEIAALAQKVATESAQPIKSQVAKSFKIAS
jgi:phasin